MDSDVILFPVIVPDIKDQICFVSVRYPEQSSNGTVEIILKSDNIGQKIDAFPEGTQRCLITFDKIEDGHFLTTEDVENGADPILPLKLAASVCDINSDPMEQIEILHKTYHHLVDTLGPHTHFNWLEANYMHHMLDLRAEEFYRTGQKGGPVQKRVDDLLF